MPRLNYVITIILLSLVPMQAVASDFVILWVGLGSLIIAVLLIIIGLVAYSAKNRDKKRGLLVVVIMLTLFGVLLIFDEASHMNDLDLYGMLATVLIPGLLAFLLPLCSLTKNGNKNK
ncbi:hypothetical protein [uncultured Paraglaciecola sp.]|uniref:hypothetical protein n=1 Tax=uncultured Paraglaciecola sp. TaxID=1765024 RepID=UPI002617804D|nr:hypothetical protein [uncultured Paraglaciecola sp.]